MPGLVNSPDRLPGRGMGKTVLQEARALERETHMLTCVKLPVARHLDIGEVDETTAWHLGSIDHAPAFLRVEPLDHACHPSEAARKTVSSPADCPTSRLADADHTCTLMPNSVAVAGAVLRDAGRRPMSVHLRLAGGDLTARIPAASRTAAACDRSCRGHRCGVSGPIAGGSHRIPVPGVGAQGAIHRVLIRFCASRRRDL